VVPPLRAVLDELARAVLGDARDEPVAIGGITLRAHQRDALHRIRAAIAEHGGALLADDPGLGKTYVALALARGYASTIVVAPAALRQMWREAATSAESDIAFISVESLSRRDAPFDPRAGLVIVDEAHHVCHPATARYARLARLIAHRRVLLMSATPVRNRRAELGALLALFMGPRAHALDEATRARCIVRRGGGSSLLPAIDGPHWHPVRAAPGVRAMIDSLPPPLPALDGREAAALLATSLARCWASSLGALDAALRRRMQRGAAMEALLADGLLPTRDELRSWVVGEDGVQLAFSMLAANVTSDAARLHDVLERHLAAVGAIRARIRPFIRSDAAARAGVLLELRRLHPGGRIIAFASQAATAEALYGVLARERGVALLTARGARTAGGRRPRGDVIRALGGSHVAHARDEISLVLATDVLSEGVNLQGASVVVHLDVPWTPAGLDQRVGRAARMGSPHATVHVHGIAPPFAAERRLKLERLLRMKHAERMAAASAPEGIERLRATMRKLQAAGFHKATTPVPVDARARVQLADGSQLQPPRPIIAAVSASRTAILAVVQGTSRLELVGGTRRGERRWDISDSPDSLAEIAGSVGCRVAQGDAHVVATALGALDRWLADRRARESSGSGTNPSHARRSLLRRLDAAVGEAPSHARAALVARIAQVRMLVAGSVSAGAERTLRELSAAGDGDLESLLASCESALSRAASPRSITSHRAEAETPAGVRALLLLRRDP
jgi:superfamily II DNA or RNA helicase